MTMDLENLTNQLNGLVVVGDRLRSFQACYSDVCVEENLLSEVKSHLENCRKTEEDLENERKGHAEELRQINQIMIIDTYKRFKDINQLEDILKTLRSERETKRARLTRQMDELRVAVNQANESIRAADISTVTLEESNDIPKELLEGHAKVVEHKFIAMPPHVQCARCEVAVKIRRGAERKASEVVSASMKR
uniref:Uncharacterized protein n=1 Tax=Angiostrongylus cantonensis TaxID=6313 RepID=A0A0K0DA44_ANGCA